MPSRAYVNWTSTRSLILSAIEEVLAIEREGVNPDSRVHALMQASVVLLASHFQGFCRDLHTECVDALVSAAALPDEMEPIVRTEFTWGRQLDRGNAQSSSLGSDFGRLGVEIWNRLRELDQDRADLNRSRLDRMNAWRNAIAHQNFDTLDHDSLDAQVVTRWRASCEQLALDLDRVLRTHLKILGGGDEPWEA
ncbi:MAG: HEPN domain-containing protein [Pirellulaceae bacterium]